MSPAVRVPRSAACARRRAFLAGSCLALLAGCVPGLSVVLRAEGEPLRDARTLALAAVAFSELRVGDAAESEWLAARDPVERVRFASDKQRFAARFAATLRELASGWAVNVLPPDGTLRRHTPASFLIRPFVTVFDPGDFSYAEGRASHVEMTVYLGTADGTPLDAIALEHDTRADGMNPSSTGRLSDDATALGVLVAEYLRARVAGDE